MFLGHNIIGLLNLSGSTECPFLRHRRSVSRVSIVVGQGISPRNASGPANSIPPHNLLWGKVQTKLFRRRRVHIRLGESTTCRFRTLPQEHLLWRVCSSPMATLLLYFLIQERRIQLSVLFS